MLQSTSQLCQPFIGSFSRPLGRCTAVIVSGNLIDLDTGSSPVRLAPHGASDKTDVEKTEVKETLRLDVIESASSE